MSEELVRKLRHTKWQYHCEVRGLIPDTTAYEAADLIEAQAKRIAELEVAVVEAAIPLEALILSGATQGMGQVMQQGVENGARFARQALAPPIATLPRFSV